MPGGKVWGYPTLLIYWINNFNGLYRKKASFHNLNNKKKSMFSAKMCFKCFGFLGNPCKNEKSKGVLTCFLVVLMKFIIVNWVALIFFLFCFFLLPKIKKIFFSIFNLLFLGTWPLLATKNAGPETVLSQKILTFLHCSIRHIDEIIE